MPHGDPAIPHGKEQQVPESTGSEQNSTTTTDNTTDSSQQQGETAEQQSGSTEGQQQSTSEDADYRKLYEDTLAQSRKWESRAKENAGKAKKWDDAEEANRTEAEKHSHRADQAEARARAATTAAINAEIRAAAHGWANPADAPRYMDDKDRYVGDNGEIDLKAIAEDTAAVLNDRPHLAAAAAEEPRRGPQPDPGQGARGGLTVADQIRDAESKGDTREALRLKSQQLLGDRRSG